MAVDIGFVEEITRTHVLENRRGPLFDIVYKLLCSLLYVFSFKTFSECSRTWHLKTLFAGLVLELLKQLHVFLVCQLVAIDAVALVQPDAHQLRGSLCTARSAEQQSLQYSTTTTTVTSQSAGLQEWPIPFRQLCDLLH